MPDTRNRGPGSVAPSPARRPRHSGDGALVQAIAAGEQAALAEAYSQHAGRVHALARGLCGQTRAEDLTQETFFQLWKNPQRYSAERGSLRSYLLMQAHARAVEILRSDTARTAREFAENLLPKAQRPDTDAAALAVLERADVDELVCALPATERDPIVLTYFGGHTYHDVARLLGVPEGTIKSGIRSGLRRLGTGFSREVNLT